MLSTSPSSGVITGDLSLWGDVERELGPIFRKIDNGQALTKADYERIQHLHLMSLGPGISAWTPPPVHIFSADAPKTKTKKVQ